MCELLCVVDHEMQAKKKFAWYKHTNTRSMQQIQLQGKMKKTVDGWIACVSYVHFMVYFFVIATRVAKLEAATTSRR